MIVRRQAKIDTAIFDLRFQMLMTKQQSSSEFSSLSKFEAGSHSDKPISGIFVSGNLALAEQNEYATETDQEHYRNHTLVFLNTDNLCVGEVFLQDERIAYCESTDLDTARQYCRQIVDERLSKESYNNEMEQPSISDFIEAIRQTNEQVDQNCLNLLKIHIRENNQPIAIDELKKQAGFDSTTGVFLQYADWARLVCDALTYFPPILPSGKDPYLGLVINYHEPELESDESLSISLTKDIFIALVQVSTL